MRAGRGAPPAAARALVEWLAGPADAWAVRGDLDEEYTEFVLPQRGRRRADRWYWRQVLLSAPRLVTRRLRGGVGMRGTAGAIAGDVRFALRVLKRRPGFAVATILTLALALGVNTTVFSVVDAVLVRPLPFAEPDRIVRPVPDELFFMNASQAQEVEARMTTFESFAAWGRTLFLFTTGGEAEEVRGARVGWQHFDMLGTEAFIGRTFVRDDAAADDAVLLSHGLWVRRFGADPGVVGSTIDLSGRDMTVIGVLRPDHVPIEFDWEAWRTLPLDPALAAGMGLAGNGRLRDGVTIEQASDDLRRVVEELWAEAGYQASPEERAGLRMERLDRWLLGDARQPLAVLSIAVLFLLLLACANVSNLLIAQSGAREREFAVRSALGGSRMRVARQLLVEVGILSLIGGAVALAVSALSLGWFRAQLPADLPRNGQIAISTTVVAFTATATFVTALITGLMPAWRGAGLGFSALTSGARGASAGRERARSRSVLVAAEMAIAVVLVIGAGLMVRTLSSLRAVDPGFVADGVVTVRPSPPSSRYPAGPELDAYYGRLTEELSRIPGVQSVGSIQFLPMTPGGWWASYVPEGRTLAEGQNAPNTAVRVVRGDYFRTMGIRLVAGRALDPSDSDEGAIGVAVVNESFASEAFEDGVALGREVSMSGEAVRIVGVVGDVKQNDLRSTSHAEVYLPFGANPWPRMHMVVRFEGDPGETTQAAAAAVRAVDAGVSMLGPRPMSDVVGGTIGSATLVAALLTLFGLVGLGLGAVGVYGVTSQAVAERRREIGIRIALGADASGVATRTVLHGMVPVALGVGAGFLGAFAGARVLDGLLFGIEARDPGTLLTAPSVLLLVALASLALPALRASRVDPVRTLREE